MDPNNNNYNNKKEQTDVAIVGIGFRLPGKSSDPIQLWNNLKNKFDGIVDATNENSAYGCRWSVNQVNSGDLKSRNAGLLEIDELKSFDPLFFGIAPNEVGLIDPQQRLLLKSTWEAFEDSGIDPNQLRGSNTSVYIGATSLDYQRNLLNDHDQKSNYFISNMHTIANRISNCFDLRGQSLTIDTACSSSSNAVQLGYESIIKGDNEYSVVGGSNILLDVLYSKTTSSLNMTGKSGYCKTFDQSADGYVRSEGASILILKNLKSAIRDGNNIYCVIKSACSNSDGSSSDKNSFFSPSKEAQSENIKMALKKGNIDASEIDYFECHGTGTPVGDPIELESISTIFKNNHHSIDNPLLIGSIKSNIGHLEPLSGVASIIKCCLMLKYRKFVPNIHFNKPNPLIKFDEWGLKVVTDIIEFPSNKLVTIGVNNFGVTGSNVCIILKEYSNDQSIKKENRNHDNQNNDDDKKMYLIPFSSNSNKSLKDYQNQILNNIQYYSSAMDFKEFVNYQILYKSLKGFPQRSVIISDSWNSLNKHFLSNQIKTLNDKSYNISHQLNSPEIVFVFCGQGPQWNGMGLQLYNNNSKFRESCDKINSIFMELADFDVLGKLRSIDSNDKISINDPLLAQTSLFILQVSLYELYKYWGINPTFVVGHSFGELSSIYSSGIISLKDACYLVYHRARLQSLTTSYDGINKDNNSRMLVINISEEEFQLKYSSKYPTIEICCINSQSSIVIGGNENHLIEIMNDSKSKDIFSSFLGAPTAFHSSFQNKIKNDLLQLEKIKLYPYKSTIKLFSTVTSSEMFSNSKDISSINILEYIFENVRKTVLFQQTIENILNYIQSYRNNNKVVFMEISPHPTLSYYIKQIVSNNESISILPSLNKKKDDIKEMNNTISELYCKGYNVNFKNQLSKQTHFLKNKLNFLPRHQWNNESKYWVESERSIKLKNEGTSINALGYSISTDINTYVSFIDIDKYPFQYLKGHMVKDKYYIPGCTYIDSIIKIFKDSDFIIPYLEFKAPIILKEDGIVTSLKTITNKTSKNEYKIVFSYKEQDKDWILCANGKIQLLNSINIVPEKVNLNKLIQQCNHAKLNKNQVYSSIKVKTGLTYLNHFQRVEECYHGNNCTFSKISIKPYITDFYDLTEFTNPSLLDTTLHGIISYLKEISQLVFDRIEDYKVYTSNFPKDISLHDYIYAYSEFLYTKGDSYYFSLSLILSDGTVVVEADKLVCTSLIPIKDSLIIDYPNDQLYSFGWQQVDSNNILLKNEEDTSINSIIINTIKPIIKEPSYYKILQIISNDDNDEIELSKSIINDLNSILGNSNEIDIEYTIVTENDNQDSENIPKFNGSLLFKKINLEQLIDDSTIIQNSNYYDIIIVSPNQTLSIESLKQLNNILKSKGYLIYSNSLMDNKKELKNIGFENNNLIYKQLMVSQKYSIFSNYYFNEIKNNINYDQIIIVSNLNSNQSNQFINQLNQYYKSSSIISISNINQFNTISSKITNKSLIYFIKTIDEMKKEDIISVSLYYIQINQFLLKKNLKVKNIIISLNSQKECFNYMNSIILGLRNYFEEELQLLLYSIDFDDHSLSKFDHNELFNTIEILTNNNYKQAEFIVRDCIPYYGTIKKERNISNKFNSTSFVNPNIIKDVMARLDPNLDYKLECKQDTIGCDIVEIETKAFALNYKDSLIYRNLVPPELSNSKGDIHNPQFCYDFSGIVSKVGSNVKEFKIGDPVFGISSSASSTHIYAHKDQIALKPINLDFIEASVTPLVYCTSLYSLFYIGQLDIINKETVLIHAGTGGVGLAAIEILKWKGFNSHLFVTVGSKEKENYLIEKYGSFITGIYSTKNIDYVKQIKLKLKQLGSDKTGVDLILNSFSNEYMESNFKCLSNIGRIVDLSITHLNISEYTDFNKFKYNISYHQVELSKLPYYIIKKLLLELSNAFSNNQIKLPPIKVYQIDQVKEAFEFINQRKLIGKISINFSDKDSLLNQLIENQQPNFHNNLLKPNYTINENSLGKTVLVTGQTGLILEILKWITKFSTSVKNIIILSKSKLKWELERLINESKNNSNNNNINYIFKSVDISNSIELNNTLDEIYNQNNMIEEIESIIHFAFQRVEHESLEIDEIDYTESISAKVFGAINLHNLSIERKLKLKQFILSSSITSIFGNIKFAGYVASNYFLDSLASYRKSIGLPAISTNYGIFGTVGFVSDQQSVKNYFDGMGYSPISINTLLGSLDLFMQNQNKSTRFIVNSFNDNMDYSNRPVGSKVEYLFNQIKKKSTTNLLSNESENNINERIISKISNLLSIDSSKLNNELRILDYGSDSLTLASLKNWIDKEFNSPNIMTISQLQSLTIDTIIKNVININNNNNNNNKNNNINKDINKLEFWKNEIKLDESIRPTEYSISNKQTVEELLKNEFLNILLTGVTGYLGSYLLSILLKKPNCSKVYCLIRNKKSKNEAINSILENLNYHQLLNGLKNEEINKIQIVIGDVSIEKFGLSNDDYENLSTNIDLIIGNAAYTNLEATYLESKDINVKSIIETIKLSCNDKIKVKPIVFISSFSIFINIERDQFEDSFLPSLKQCEETNNGYAQSKIVSEYLIKEASNRGIPSMIIRLPFLYSNSKTGIGNKNDFLMLQVQCCLILKSFPMDYIQSFNSVPIDWISESIIKLIFNNNSWLINNNHYNNILVFYNLVGESCKFLDMISQTIEKYQLKPIKLVEWIQLLNNSTNKQCQKQKEFHSKLISNKNKLLSSNIYTSKNSIELLESNGMNYNDSKITFKIMEKNINYYLNN